MYYFDFTSYSEHSNDSTSILSNTLLRLTALFKEGSKTAGVLMIFDIIGSSASLSINYNLFTIRSQGLSSCLNILSNCFMISGSNIQPEGISEKQCFAKSFFCSSYFPSN